MEVIASERLQKKAIDQWTRELPLKASRGKILSSNGTALATNKSSYAVYIRTRQVKNPERVASVLSQIFGVDEQKLLDKMRKKATSEITVKRQVDKESIVKLTNYQLDGVYYSVDNTRLYPYNQLLCSVLGYSSIDGGGQTGLELYYDKYLKGVDGEVLYESDLTGQDIKDKTPSYTPAVNGLNVVTTIDIGIQQVVEAALEKAYKTYTPKGCSAVVLDPQTGRVLAMANLPSFDLNAPPRNDIATLNALSRNTLVVDCYEPGSTFKVVTALANVNQALKGDKSAKSLDYIYSSNRYRELAGGRIKCWSDHKNGKHSNQTLALALNNRCNPCFTDIALSLGTKTFYSYITALGFGKKTGIDFPGEASGVIIPENSVKIGDLARIGFGQSVSVTPIQLAAAVSAAVNGGNYYKPYIVDKITTEDGRLVESFSPTLKGQVATIKASAILAGYLEDVVTSGSGKNAYIEGYKIGGKTGTAQKFVDGKIAQGKYVMSFVGFMPSNKPEYLCLVIVDEPVGGNYGSTVAAPVAGQIFKGIIDLKDIEPII
ncbi:MAG: stage V sporulation protein D [Clostridia bacterium]|nr:stage V sporulation protein D [Clostridia bacterium]